LSKASFEFLEKIQLPFGFADVLPHSIGNALMDAKAKAFGLAILYHYV